MDYSKNAHQHLDEQLPLSKFNFGEKFSIGADIWKEHFGLIGVFFLLYGIIMFFLNMIPIIGGLVSTFFLGPILTVGIFLFIKKADFRENPEFGDFFNGFDFAKDAVIATIIQMVIMIIPLLIMGLLFYSGLDLEAFVNAEEDPEAFLEAMRSISIPLVLIAGLVFTILSALFSFVYPFITYYRLDAMSAVKYSFKFVSKHLVMFVLLYIVAAIIGMLGAILCFVGLIFTVPIIYTVIYAMFRELTDLRGFLDDSDEGDNLVKSLVDF